MLEGKGSSRPMEQRCPTCRGGVERGALTFPFCSARCRYIDLGRWFNEEYRVTSESQSDDEETGLPESDPDHDE